NEQSLSTRNARYQADTTPIALALLALGLLGRASRDRHPVGPFDGSRRLCALRVGAHRTSDTQIMTSCSTHWKRNSRYSAALLQSRPSKKGATRCSTKSALPHWLA